MTSNFPGIERDSSSIVLEMLSNDSLSCVARTDKKRRPWAEEVLWKRRFQADTPHTFIKPPNRTWKEHYFYNRTLRGSFEEGWQRAETIAPEIVIQAVRLAAKTLSGTALGGVGLIGYGYSHYRESTLPNSSFLQGIGLTSSVHLLNASNEQKTAIHMILLFGGGVLAALSTFSHSTNSLDNFKGIAICVTLSHVIPALNVFGQNLQCAILSEAEPELRRAVWNRRFDRWKVTRFLCGIANAAFVTLHNWAN